ncbi:ORF2 [Badnavirus tessellopandani]|uniref:ORF2 n=1 Tax=Pandanus badnavirus TaxID=2975548 RepID=A0AAE9NVN0_9VIRU|nr:ORF2 [Pandanus badnavirus]
MSVSQKDYLEALLNTNSLGAPSQGFIKDTEVSTSGQVSIQKSIIKQNNSIIELLVSLHKKLDKLQIEKDTQKSIDDLSEQLSKISLGSTSSTSAQAKKKTPFYVFKDPQLIFEEEKVKLLSM